MTKLPLLQSTISAFGKSGLVLPPSCSLKTGKLLIVVSPDPWNCQSSADFSSFQLLRVHASVLGPYSWSVCCGKEKALLENGYIQFYYPSPYGFPFFEILFIPLIGYHNSSCILSVFEQFLNFWWNKMFQVHLVFSLPQYKS